MSIETSILRKTYTSSLPHPYSHLLQKFLASPLLSSPTIPCLPTPQWTSCILMGNNKVLFVSAEVSFSLPHFHGTSINLNLTKPYFQLFQNSPSWANTPSVRVSLNFFLETHPNPLAVLVTCVSETYYYPFYSFSITIFSDTVISDLDSCKDLFLCLFQFLHLALCNQLPKSRENFKGSSKHVLLSPRFPSDNRSELKITATVCVQSQEVRMRDKGKGGPWASVPL